MVALMGATIGKTYSGSQASAEQIWRRRVGSHYDATRRKTSDALVPPNPKEFDSTTLTGRF
jgi:hypothetical protein